MTAPVVHLVCKTHLDLGFTDMAAAVRDRYVEDFIPSALAVAAQLRDEAGPVRFVWTTGSWLVDTFLEGAGRDGRRRMEQAIDAGDIAWHTLPFTMHSELCDRSLFEHGLSISARLDRRFGRHTIAAKMTDVPGHTRGIVRLLAAAGVELLHIGVNPACPAPEVPPVFRWRSPDGTEVVVAYQAGGYGGAVQVPGLADGLVVAHTDDNKGPQTVEQVRDVFASVGSSHPGAEVCASTLDRFAIALRSVRDTLPVVTQELGDTWIHGVGTDPQKVARFRELSRLRGEWIEAGQDPDEPTFAAASTSLLLVAEHTWGLDEKVVLGDDARYAAADLAVLRSEPAGRRFEASWAEQRSYVDRFVRALPEPLRIEAEHRLARLDPSSGGSSPDLAPPVGDIGGPGRVAASGRRFDVGPFEVSVDPATGGLDSVVDLRTGRQWAGTDHQLGRYRYQSFDGHDYDRFHRGYNCARPEDEWWARLDYTKPGIDGAGAISAWWHPIDVHVWRVGDAGLRIETTMPAEATAELGCPPSVLLEWSFPRSGPITFEVGWSAKPAGRLPEAGWVSFAPVVDDPTGWTLDKLGEDVSPLDVARRGGRHLHAVGRGASHAGVDATIRLDTFDAPLVAPGAPRLLDPADDQPDLAGGMHVNLHNNVWGTNFPMWNEGPARFRFGLELVDRRG